MGKKNQINRKRKKKRKIKNKKLLLKTIHDNRENKNNIKLAILLRDWLHRALIIRNNTSAKKIQDKYRKFKNKQKENQSKDILRNLFVKKFKNIISCYFLY